MATTEKAISIIRELTDKLAIRMGPAGANLALAQGFGSAGDPTLSIGDGVAGDQNVFFRCVPVGSIQKDVLGLQQNVYTPHILQIALETSSITSVPLDTVATLMPVMWEAFQKGTIVQIWLETNGTAPTESTFSTASKMKVQLDSLYWPLSGQ